MIYRFLHEFTKHADFMKFKFWRDFSVGKCSVLEWFQYWSSFSNTEFPKNADLSVAIISVLAISVLE